MASQDSFGAKGDPRGRRTSRTRSSGSTRSTGCRARCPFSLKVLLENLLRTEDGANITADHIRALGRLGRRRPSPSKEIQFTPGARDHAGLHRRALRRRPRHDARGDGRPRRRPGADQPARAGRAGHRPLGASPTCSAPRDAFERNVELEYERNRERYQFLRWGQTAFDDFKVVPPGTGIVHQVNIEYLARVVFTASATAQRRLPRHAASAPTRTPRWSTASACSAGASAASRPRPRCSASRCRC